MKFWSYAEHGIFFIVISYITSLLRDKLDNEKRLARIDGLTSLRNSRSFYEEATVAVELAVRLKHPASLAYIDLDDFKRINDEYGHKAGDELLNLVAAVIRDAVRIVDIPARLGGDEFAIFFTNCDFNNAGIIIRRIIQTFNEFTGTKGYRVSMSVGLITYDDAGICLDEMFREADGLMYRVKTSGKNNVIHKRG